MKDMDDYSLYNLEAELPWEEPEELDDGPEYTAAELETIEMPF